MSYQHIVVPTTGSKIAVRPDFSLDVPMILLSLLFRATVLASI